MQVFISNWNIRRLFKNKESILHIDTRSSIAVDYGITTPFLSRAATFIGTLVLILTIAGSFSIDGRTRPGTRIAQSLVVRARGPEEIIDYSKHVSEDGRRISGTLLLIKSATECREYNSTMTTMHSMVGGDVNLNGTVYDVDETPKNRTCRFEVQEFQENVTFRLTPIPADVEGCKFIYDRTGRDSGIWLSNATIRECEIEAVETWCAKFLQHVCITQARHSEGYLHITALLENEFGPQDSSSIVPYVYEKADDKRVLQSMAYLYAMRVHPAFAALRIMALSVVRLNEPVEMLRMGRVQETVINLWLLGFTAGTALLVTVFMLVVTLLLWKENTKDMKLRDCKGVSSALDAMLFAASIALGNKDYEVPKDGILVGVSRRVPHVGPLRDFEEWDLLNEQGYIYDEHELEGRG